MSTEYPTTASERIAFALDVERGSDRTPVQSPEAKAEAEERAALEKMVDDSGIRRVEQLLDGENMRLVLTLTPAKWREFGPYQRKALLDWTVRRIKALDEKSAFMSRNMAVGELELPDYLREKGAA